MPLPIHRGTGYKRGCARDPGMATLLSAGGGWQKYSLRGLPRVARMYRLSPSGGLWTSGKFLSSHMVYSGDSDSHLGCILRTQVGSQGGYLCNRKLCGCWDHQI